MANTYELRAEHSFVTSDGQDLERKLDSLDKKLDRHGRGMDKAGDQAAKAGRKHGELGTKVGKASKAARDARGRFVRAGDAVQKAGRKAGGAAAGFGKLRSGIAGVTIALAAVAAAGAATVGAYATQEAADKRLEAQITATSGALGLNVQQLKAQASALQAATGIGDEYLQTQQAFLISFKNIGPEVFGRTIELAEDMKQVLPAGGEALTQLAKALDQLGAGSIAGVTALRRSGTILTEAKTAQIKALAETGQALEAQKILLAEVESQYGGVARAMRDTTAGAARALKSELGDLAEVMGGKVAPQARGLTEDLILLTQQIKATLQGRFAEDVLPGIFVHGREAVDKYRLGVELAAAADKKWREEQLLQVQVFDRHQAEVSESTEWAGKLAKAGAAVVEQLKREEQAQQRAADKARAHSDALRELIAAEQDLVGAGDAAMRRLQAGLEAPAAVTAIDTGEAAEAAAQEYRDRFESIFGPLILEEIPIDFGERMVITTERIAPTIGEILKGELSGVASAFGGALVDLAAGGSAGGAARGISGAAGSAASSAAGGGFAGGVAGGLVALYFQELGNFLDDRERRAAQNTFGAVATLDDGARSLGTLTGGDTTAQLNAILDDLERALQGTLQYLGGFTTDLAAVGISVSQSGDRFKVEVEGAYIGFFDSYEQAIAAAVGKTLQASLGGIEGLSSNAQRVLIGMGQALDIQALEIVASLDNLIGPRAESFSDLALLASQAWSAVQAYNLSAADYVEWVHRETEALTANARATLAGVSGIQTFGTAMIDAVRAAELHNRGLAAQEAQQRSLVEQTRAQLAATEAALAAQGEYTAAQVDAAQAAADAGGELSSASAPFISLGRDIDDFKGILTETGISVADALTPLAELGPDALLPTALDAELLTEQLAALEAGLEAFPQQISDLEIQIAAVSPFRSLLGDLARLTGDEQVRAELQRLTAQADIASLRIRHAEILVQQSMLAENLRLSQAQLDLLSGAIDAGVAAIERGGSLSGGGGGRGRREAARAARESAEAELELMRARQAGGQEAVAEILRTRELEETVARITEALGEAAGEEARRLSQLEREAEILREIAGLGQGIAGAAAPFRDFMETLSLSDIERDMLGLGDRVQEALAEVARLLEESGGALGEEALRALRDIQDAFPEMLADLLSDGIAAAGDDPEALRELQETLRELLADLPDVLSGQEGPIQAAIDELGTLIAGGLAAAADEALRVAEELAADLASRLADFDQALESQRSIGPFADQLAALGRQYDEQRAELEALAAEYDSAGLSLEGYAARLAELDALQASGAESIQLGFLASLRSLGVEVPGLAEALIQAEFAMARAQAIALFAGEQATQQWAASHVALTQATAVASHDAWGQWGAAHYDSTRGTGTASLTLWDGWGTGMLDKTQAVAVGMLQTMDAAAAAAGKPQVGDNIADFFHKGPRSLPTRGPIGGGGPDAGSLDFGDIQIPGTSITLADLLEMLDSAEAAALAALLGGGADGAGGAAGGVGGVADAFDRLRQEAESFLDSITRMEIANLDPLDQINAQFDEMADRAAELAAAFPGLGTSLSEVQDRIEALRAEAIVEEWERALGSFRSGIESMRQEGPSGIAGLGAVEDAQARFQELATAAASGDIGAARQLEAARTNLLRLAEQQGSPALLRRIRSMILAQGDLVMGGGFDAGEGAAGGVPFAADDLIERPAAITPQDLIAAPVPMQDIAGYLSQVMYNIPLADPQGRSAGSPVSLTLEELRGIRQALEAREARSAPADERREAYLRASAVERVRLRRREDIRPSAGRGVSLR
ncbi:MAG: hypothetical protein GY719_25920 [bacterium]|nr:hypothetical protein [bacterium]